MDTPIKDFLESYALSHSIRLHMPGHKGNSISGIEKFDITEIDGADCLYNDNGIIKKSRENASKLFGCHTFYSTEGSSLSIKAMLYLALKHAKDKKNAFVLAGRNAHKSFISAVGLLGLDVMWLCPKNNKNYLSCNITAKEVEKVLSKLKRLPIALYLTSPDYLGNSIDIKAIKTVCRKFGILLLVDNAHGSYLKFLSPSCHPIDLGADMCCDSAHKTLPALTGSAYLHLSKSLPSSIVDDAQQALSIFASTSPSYLILSSLDQLNKTLDDGYVNSLKEFVNKVAITKKTLIERGFTLVGNEPLKLTIATKPYGYYGQEIYEYLKERNIFCEFYDKDYLVAMLSPSLGEDSIDKTLNALLSLPKKQAILSPTPIMLKTKSAMPIRKALLSDTERIPVKNAEGRIFAEFCLSCPPAVAPVICGEVINYSTIDCLEYYGINTCLVIK